MRDRQPHPSSSLILFVSLTMAQLPALAAEPALKLKERVPDTAEAQAIGPITKIVKRDSADFKAFTKYERNDTLFKDEEKTGADRMMTKNLAAKVEALAAKVGQEWPGVKLRITEAWDENMEHGNQKAPAEQRRSAHYEGRAIDCTTSDQDKSKYGRLAKLAVDSGFDWVWYENEVHVHASVK